MVEWAGKRRKKIERSPTSDYPPFINVWASKIIFHLYAILNWYSSLFRILYIRLMLLSACARIIVIICSYFLLYIIDNQQSHQHWCPFDSTTQQFKTTIFKYRFKYKPANCVSRARTKRSDEWKWKREILRVFQLQVLDAIWARVSSVWASKIIFHL